MFGTNTDVGRKKSTVLGPGIVSLAVPVAVAGLATSWIPAAGLATSGHCPGPWVGRDGQVPSQPTAAAGAGPDFSYAGEL